MTFALGMDVGCGECVISGKIKVKSGVGIHEFTQGGLLLDDDTVLEADVVVFA